jgi:hypothetical protein
VVLATDRKRGRLVSVAEPASSRFIPRRNICWRTMRVNSPFWSWRKQTQARACTPSSRW